MTKDSQDEVDSFEDDTALQLQRDIAERLSELSEIPDTPDEFDSSHSEFSASDVNFEDETWMSRVAEVQGWLRLDGELSTSSSESFMSSLSQGLGLDPDIDVDWSTQIPQLTIEGLGRLFERADQAFRIQQVFAQKYLDDGVSLPAASRAWSEAWDDEPEEDDEEPIRTVSAKADAWRISDFTGKKLNLAPSYQRGDVWNSTARQMLIESILRGIPLPSVILLKPEAATSRHEVVDGKQRLTAILRFVGKHPIAIERVKAVDASHDQKGELLKAFQEDYPRFKKMWKSLEHESVTARVEDENYFPFRLRSKSPGLTGNLEALRGKYFTEITDHEIEAADEATEIGELFRGVPEYRIPVIVYKRATQSQIHEVFNIYNKQGTHLNAEEIRNAVFHELELTRAILVAAGDSDPHSDVKTIASSLVPVWNKVSHLGGTLNSYGFGRSRYRRTKILAWVLATLLGDTEGKDLSSTSVHINNLLKEVQRDEKHRLRRHAALAELFEWISQATLLHASFSPELWADAFIDGESGQKWQELQLVGSMVGIAIAYISDPDNIEETLSQKSNEIYDASSTANQEEGTSAWVRPRKTQSKDQWVYIASIAKAITDILQVDTTVASSRIRDSFGASGVETLFAAIDDETE